MEDEGPPPSLRPWPEPPSARTSTLLCNRTKEWHCPRLVARRGLFSGFAVTFKEIGRSSFVFSIGMVHNCREVRECGKVGAARRRRMDTRRRLSAVRRVGGWPFVFASVFHATLAAAQGEPSGATCASRLVVGAETISATWEPAVARL